MVKTKGSTDLRNRKQRKDKGKRRKRYAGRPTKKKRKRHGRLVPYISKRKRGDPLKLWFWEQKIMSSDGYRRWSKRMRPYIKKTIYLFVDKPFFVKPEDISTPEKIGELACERIQYPGTFYAMFPTHSKNSFRVSFKRKATVVIRETGDEELVARVFNFSKMKKYWFFKDR